MSTSPFFRVFAITAASTIAALGHFTWIAPVAALEPGKPAVIRISHGHKFPAGEEAINSNQVEAYAIAPSGAKVKLAAKVEGQALSAAFTPREKGVYRIVMVQDRGVVSRTPRGVKPGGRESNPDATQSYHAIRTAVAYAQSGRGTATSGKAAGLAVELTGERAAGGTWRLRLLRAGRPAPNTVVSVFTAGTSGAVEIGKTGADGVVQYQGPADGKGPTMFSAEFKEPAPTGSKFDTMNYSTSLYVKW